MNAYIWHETLNLDLMRKLLGFLCVCALAIVTARAQDAVEFYEDGNEVISIWKPQPQFQGWIDTLHGGIQAVLLDEICAWVVLRKLQTTGVTSKMETRYMKPVNTNDSYIVLKASIKERKRNIVFVEAAIYNNKEELCTKALCTYFTFPKEKAKEEMHFLSCGVEDEEILPLI